MVAFSPMAIRRQAAELVERHAARLGMDQFAANTLVDAISSMPLREPDGVWIETNGKKPDLPALRFVIARLEGESRQEAESWRDGYGEAVDRIDWLHVIEYRPKDPAA